MLKSPEDFINYVYRSGAGKSEISGIAGIVDAAFQSGDECAEKILKESACELFLCAKSVMERLKLTDKPVQVAASGSVLVNNKYIFKEFSALMEESYPMAGIGLARDDAAWGAVLMALNKSSDLEGDYAGQSVKD
jgi:N-acetylglucosamine kinase-like BadF-type ATPase